MSMTEKQLQEKLVYIDKLIEDGLINEACEEYILIATSIQDKENEILDNVKAEFFASFAYFLFNVSEYEECLKMFKKAQNYGYSKEEIRELIWRAFVEPNLDEFKDTYNKNIEFLLSKGYILNSVKFEELTFWLIPTSVKKEYYIYDKKERLIKEKFEFNASCNFSLPSISDEFSDFLILEEWNWNKVKSYANLIGKNNRKSYVIVKDFNKLLSCFQGDILSEEENPSFLIFDGFNNIKEYFNGGSEYLPRNIIDLMNSYVQAKNVIDEIHEKRIKNNVSNRNNVILSICIPTYNRGNRALENIKHLLNSSYDAEVEFVISNNGSTKGREEYNQIKEMRDSRISYFEFDSNQGVLINICKVLDVAKGKFAVLISDEDSIDLDSLSAYLNLLKNNSDLGFVLCGTAKYYRNLKSEFAKAGDEAFLKTFLACNYITGNMYNVKKLHEYNLIEDAIRNSDNIFCAIYPHMWLNAFMSIKSDIYIYSKVLCIEGEAEQGENNPDYLQEKSNVEGLVKYISYTGRMDQHKAIIQLINMIPFKSKRSLLQAYSSLCWKTNFLVSIVKDKYIKSGYDWNEIYDELYKCCLEGIYKLDVEITTEIKQQLEKAIRVHNNKFRK